MRWAITAAVCAACTTTQVYSVLTVETAAHERGQRVQYGPCAAVAVADDERLVSCYESHHVELTSSGAALLIGVPLLVVGGALYLIAKNPPG